MVIATTRPELLDRRPDSGGGRRNASLVWLDALGPEDAESMLDGLVAASLPDRLRALVAERAEGNPFFVEELVAALVDGGVLRRSEDGWVAHEDVDDVAVPDSVHAVLAARIDLLPPGAKDALQAASVVGRSFWRRPLARLLDGTEPDLAVRLFSRASELEGVGHEPVLDPPRLRLALLRGDREAAARLVDRPVARPYVWGPSIAATRLDALAMLRRVDCVEGQAPSLCQPGATSSRSRCERWASCATMPRCSPVPPSCSRRSASTGTPRRPTRSPRSARRRG